MNDVSDSLGISLGTNSDVESVGGGRRPPTNPPAQAEAAIAADRRDEAPDLAADAAGAPWQAVAPRGRRRRQEEDAAAGLRAAPARRGAGRGAGNRGRGPARGRRQTPAWLQAMLDAGMSPAEIRLARAQRPQRSPSPRPQRAPSPADFPATPAELAGCSRHTTKCLAARPRSSCVRSNGTSRRVKKLRFCVSFMKGCCDSSPLTLLPWQAYHHRTFQPRRSSHSRRSCRRRYFSCQRHCRRHRSFHRRGCLRNCRRRRPFHRQGCHRSCRRGSCLLRRRRCSRPPRPSWRLRSRKQSQRYCSARELYRYV